MSINKNEDKLVYSGNSLDEYLSVKEKLRNNNIKFTESLKSNDSWLRFFFLLFIRTGTYGMHGERVRDYKIYVNKNDFPQAQEILKI